MSRDPDSTARDTTGAHEVQVTDELQVREPAAAARAQEPPVVARLVVEIRSDGRRTIARGAMEDKLHGDQVAVEARGDSPLSLAMGLVRSIMKAPGLARGRGLGLLLGRPRKR